MIKEQENHVFSLKWENHESTFISSINNMFKKSQYCDVTLVANETFFPVHKVILSHWSSHFDKMFEKTPCKHPFVILNDVEDRILKSLLKFMYEGEVELPKNDVITFIRVADTLKIRGLLKENWKETICNDSGDLDPEKIQMATTNRKEKNCPNESYAGIYKSPATINLERKNSNTNNAILLPRRAMGIPPNKKFAYPGTHKKAFNISESKNEEADDSDIEILDSIDCSPPSDLIVPVSLNNNNLKKKNLNTSRPTLSPSTNGQVNQSTLNPVFSPIVRNVRRKTPSSELSKHMNQQEKRNSWEFEGFSSNDKLLIASESCCLSHGVKACNICLINELFEDEDNDGESMEPSSKVPVAKISSQSGNLIADKIILNKTKASEALNTSNVANSRTASFSKRSKMHKLLGKKTVNKKVNKDKKMSKPKYTLMGVIGKKLLNCDICSFKTLSKSVFDKHIKMHPSTIHCSVCPFTTRSDATLLRHIPRHKLDIKEFPFKCSFCSYRTKREIGISAHESIHKKQENYLNVNYEGNSLSCSSIASDSNTTSVTYNESIERVLTKEPLKSISNIDILPSKSSKSFSNVS